MNIIKENKPAISKPINNTELSIKAYLANYRYLNNQELISTASNDTPLFRYAKNYIQNNTTYSLIMISTDNNAKAISVYFDQLSEKIKTTVNIKKILTSEVFSYLDEFYGEQK